MTSERGTVIAVDPKAQLLYAAMDDGRQHVLRTEGLGIDRLAHGYAMTVHRSQGATVDSAHRYEDGGGRELAYVAMSRARNSAKSYVVADSLAQASEDLRREWSAERRIRWAIDQIRPAPEPTSKGDLTPSPETGLRHGRLRAERAALVANIPTDPTGQIVALNAKLTRLEQDRQDLELGRGRYAGTETGQAAADLLEARAQRHRIDGHLGSPAMGWRMRRSWQREAGEWARRETVAKDSCDRLVAPEMARLNDEIEVLSKATRTLVETRQRGADWLWRHPKVRGRLERLDRDILAIEHELGLASVVRTPEQLGLHRLIESDSRMPEVVRELDDPHLGLGL